MFLFFIIIPIIVGVFKYKELDFAYRLLLYSSCISFINQCLNYLFYRVPGYKLSPFWNNIFNYQSQLLSLPILVFIAFSWLGLQKKNQLTFIFFLFCITSVFLEIYMIGMDEIRGSFALLFCTLIVIFIFVNSLNYLLKKQMIIKEKRSKLLIILPFIIGDIYSISLDIYIYYLYSDETALIFQMLYHVLMAIVALKLLCTALSIWLAPKKEVFI